jgi:hypothetical protein
MKNLSTLSYFFGLEVSYSCWVLSFPRKVCLRSFVSRWLTDCKIDDCPLETNVNLCATDGEPLLDATVYRKLVGSLIYLTFTQPYSQCCFSKKKNLNVVHLVN